MAGRHPRGDFALADTLLTRAIEPQSLPQIQKALPSAWPPHKLPAARSDHSSPPPRIRNSVTTTNARDSSSPGQFGLSPAPSLAKPNREFQATPKKAKPNEPPSFVGSDSRDMSPPGKMLVTMDESPHRRQSLQTTNDPESPSRDFGTQMDASPRDDEYENVPPEGIEIYQLSRPSTTHTAVSRMSKTHEVSLAYKKARSRRSKSRGDDRNPQRMQRAQEILAESIGPNLASSARGNRTRKSKAADAIWGQKAQRTRPLTVSPRRLGAERDRYGFELIDNTSNDGPNNPFSKRRSKSGLGLRTSTLRSYHEAGLKDVGLALRQSDFRDGEYFGLGDDSIHTAMENTHLNSRGSMGMSAAMGGVVGPRSASVDSALGRRDDQSIDVSQYDGGVQSRLGGTAPASGRERLQSRGGNLSREGLGTRGGSRGNVRFVAIEDDGDERSDDGDHDGDIHGDLYDCDYGGEHLSRGTTPGSPISGGIRPGTSVSGATRSRPGSRLRGVGNNGKLSAITSTRTRSRLYEDQHSPNVSPLEGNSAHGVGGDKYLGQSSSGANVQRVGRLSPLAPEQTLAGAEDELRSFLGSIGCQSLLSDDERQNAARAHILEQGRLLSHPETSFLPILAAAKNLNRAVDDGRVTEDDIAEMQNSHGQELGHELSVDDDANAVGQRSMKRPPSLQLGSASVTAVAEEDTEITTVMQAQRAAAIWMKMTSKENFAKTTGSSSGTQSTPFAKLGEMGSASAATVMSVMGVSFSPMFSPLADPTHASSSPKGGATLPREVAIATRAVTKLMSLQREGSQVMSPANLERMMSGISTDGLRTAKLQRGASIASMLTPAVGSPAQGPAGLESASQSKPDLARTASLISQGSATSLNSHGSTSQPGSPRSPRGLSGLGGASKRKEEWFKLWYRSEEECMALFQKARIPIDEWGTDKAKSFKDLMDEVKSGNFELQINPQGQIRRYMRLAKVRIVRMTKILIEAYEQLPDKPMKERLQLLTVKIKTGQEPLAAASNALQKELAGMLAERMLSKKIEVHRETKFAPSYPGLIGFCENFIFDCDGTELPQKDFQTVEDNSSKAKHFWTWKDREEWRVLDAEKRAVLEKSSQMMMEKIQYAASKWDSMAAKQGDAIQQLGLPRPPAWLAKFRDPEFFSSRMNIVIDDSDSDDESHPSHRHPGRDVDRDSDGNGRGNGHDDVQSARLGSRTGSPSSHTATESSPATGSESQPSIGLPPPIALPPPMYSGFSPGERLVPTSPNGRVQLLDIDLSVPIDSATNTDTNPTVETAAACTVGAGVVPIAASPEPREGPITVATDLEVNPVPASPANPVQLLDIELAPIHEGQEDSFDDCVSPSDNKLDPATAASTAKRSGSNVSVIIPNMPPSPSAHMPISSSGSLIIPVSPPRPFGHRTDSPSQTGVGLNISSLVSVGNIREPTGLPGAPQKTIVTFANDVDGDLDANGVGAVGSRTQTLATSSNDRGILNPVLNAVTGPFEIDVGGFQINAADSKELELEARVSRGVSQFVNLQDESLLMPTDQEVAEQVEKVHEFIEARAERRLLARVQAHKNTWNAQNRTNVNDRKIRLLATTGKYEAAAELRVAPTTSDVDPAADPADVQWLRRKKRATTFTPARTVKSEQARAEHAKHGFRTATASSKLLTPAKAKHASSGCHNGSPPTAGGSGSTGTIPRVKKRRPAPSEVTIPSVEERLKQTNISREAAHALLDPKRPASERKWLRTHSKKCRAGEEIAARRKFWEDLFTLLDVDKKGNVHTSMLRKVFDVLGVKQSEHDIAELLKQSNMSVAADLSIDQFEQVMENSRSKILEPWFGAKGKYKGELPNIKRIPANRQEMVKAIASTYLTRKAAAEFVFRSIDRDFSMSLDISEIYTALEHLDSQSKKQCGHLVALCEEALHDPDRKSEEINLQDWIRLLDRVDGMYRDPKYERAGNRRRSSDMEKTIIKAIETSKAQAAAAAGQTAKK